MSVDDDYRQRALAANLRHLERKLTPAQLAEIRSPSATGSVAVPTDEGLEALADRAEMREIAQAVASVAEGATVPAVPRAADPVGLQEIIERLGVSPSTPRQWRYRGKFPPPDYEAINGLQAWEWTTVLRWAGATGKLREGTALYDEFVERFGSKPLEPRVGGSMTQEQAARSEKLLNPRKRKQAT